MQKYIEFENGSLAICVDTTSTNFGLLFFKHPDSGAWAFKRRALPHELQKALRKQVQILEDSHEPGRG